jgi:hypothetical protein
MFFRKVTVSMGDVSMDVWTIFLALGLCVAIGSAFFCACDAKAHAQPVRFLLAALGAIMLAFLASFLAEKFKTSSNENTRQIAYFWTQISGVVNLTCGAFSGALASAAITNRAKFRHDEKTILLKASLANAARSSREAFKQLSIMNTTPLSYDPADSNEAKKRFQKVSEITLKLADEIEKLNKELEELGIK